MLREEIDDAKRTVNTDADHHSKSLPCIRKGNSTFCLTFKGHRWSLAKKSNFVESVLIGIPIPSLFVFETADGVWELVDGLQRVSTILEFMGILKDVDRPDQAKRSVLIGAKYLPGLECVAWNLNRRARNRWTNHSNCFSDVRASIS